MSILGNHEGAGFANFPTYESADAFAAQLEQVVNTYHLDGIDFDDGMLNTEKMGRLNQIILRSFGYFKP